jgi:RNA polymerase sigma-70 factor, ECF subfamily
MAPSTHELTQLLKACGSGDKGALKKLMPIVYEDLRRVAKRQMANEREGHTLQTTALVHEAYLRLVDSKQATWQDRAHSFAICARQMQQILVDAARSRRAWKRGGDVKVIELDEAMAAQAKPLLDVIALDEALTAISAFDERKAKVVELRIFGGLSLEETANVLHISTDTVTRDLNAATAWLRRELGPESRYDA